MNCYYLKLQRFAICEERGVSKHELKFPLRWKKDWNSCDRISYFIISIPSSKSILRIRYPIPSYNTASPAYIPLTSYKVLFLKYSFRYVLIFVLFRLLRKHPPIVPLFLFRAPPVRAPLSPWPASPDSFSFNPFLFTKMNWVNLKHNIFKHTYKFVINIISMIQYK